MIREPKSGPLLVTAEVAAKIGRLLRRPFRGYNGVEVRDTLDGVSVGLAPVSRRGGAAVSARPWQWAVLDGLTESQLIVHLLDDSGSPVFGQITVSVLGSTSAGFTITPPLAQCVPQFVAGDIIRVVETTGFRAGWWLHDLVFVTEVCA